MQAPPPGYPQQGQQQAYAPQAPPGIDFELLFNFPPLLGTRSIAVYQHEAPADLIERDLGIVRGCHDPRVESRRVELPSAILRRLKLSNRPVRVQLDLKELKYTHEHKIVGGWRLVGGGGLFDSSRTEVADVRDPWLGIQGELFDGVYFELHRVEAFHVKKTVTHRGRTIRTSWEAMGSWEQSLLLRFPPGRFERLAKEGPRRDLLVLPDGLEVRHFAGGPDHLVLVIASRPKWDVPQPSMQANGVNAADLVTLQFVNLYAQLGKPEDSPYGKADAARPLQYHRVPPEHLRIRGTFDKYGIGLIGIAVGLFLAMIAIGNVRGIFDHIERSESYDRRAAREPAMRAEHKKDSQREWERAEAAITSSIVYGVLTVIALGGGGFFMYRGVSRERARAAQLEQRRRAAGI